MHSCVRPSWLSVVASLCCRSVSVKVYRLWSVDFLLYHDGSREFLLLSRQKAGECRVQRLPSSRRYIVS